MRCLIADLIVEIPDAGGLAPRCREYLTDQNDRADIIIRTERYHREKYAQDTDEEIIAYQESGRQFATQLLFFNGFYLHASAVEVDGKAYLFSAPSGTGKSTHTQLWKRMFGETAYIINDDKPALRYLDGKWYAYGTPWCGKDGINMNRKVPVAGICFLKQASYNKIRPLSTPKAVPLLLSQTIHGFKSKERLLYLLNHLEKLVEEIPVFELENLPDLEAAKLSYETMCHAALEKKHEN